MASDEDEDEDREFSHNDLNDLPELSLQIDDASARRRAFSEGSGIGLSIAADDIALGRARVWSSGGGAYSFRSLRSPEGERSVHSKRGILRRFSKKSSEPGEAFQIPEKDLLREDFSLGTLSPLNHERRVIPRLSLSSYNPSSSRIEDSETQSPSNHERRTIVPRLSLSSYNPSSAKVVDESENSTRPPLKDYSLREEQQSNSNVGLSSPTSELYDDNDDDYSSFRTNGSAEGDERRPLSLWGIPLPAWLAKKRPSWNRVAACVVTRAPCFCCFPLSQKTDRAVVQRLNILCAFFAFVQLFSAVMLFVYLNGDMVEHDLTESEPADDLARSNSSAPTIQVMPYVWNINGAVFALGSISLLLLAMTIVIVPVVRNVNLVGAIRYLWLLLWLIPIQIYSVIGLFDYFRVTKVWVKHWWRHESLATFRRAFCEPSSTYNTLCAAPEVKNVTSWCLANFNATNCGDIRTKAQESMDTFMITYYYGNAIWGILLALLLLLVVLILESIISRPLVQKSRESNVPAWFSLPILGCIGNGLLFIFSTSSELVDQADRSSTFWIGVIYVAAGGLFFLAAVLGWFISFYSILNTRDKRYKMVAVNFFILVSAAVFILLIWIVGGSIAFSISLVEDPLSTEERGNIACFLDQANACTGCDQDPSSASSIRCPEWTMDDVTKVLQSQAKSSASLAAIFLLYAMSAMRFGFSTRRFIRLYQIDYV